MTEKHKIENAVVENVTVFIERGVLTAEVHLAGQGWNTCFGSYRLAPVESPAEADNAAAIWLCKVMTVCGASSLDLCKGKIVRVKSLDRKTVAIGHAVEDIWFTPSEDLK